MNHKEDLDFTQLRERIHSFVQSLFQIEDISGLELFTLLHRVTRLSEMMECQPSESDQQELSGPRWRLMLRLLIEEHVGNMQGITPTHLSHSQRVSKNTISSLLRGLEDQGLVQRTLDSKDLRLFRIQLTPAGRDLILRTAPERIESLNRLLSALSPEEIAQLTGLLTKLSNSFMNKCHPGDLDSNLN